MLSNSAPTKKGVKRPASEELTSPRPEKKIKLPPELPLLKVNDSLKIVIGSIPTLQEFLGDKEFFRFTSLNKNLYELQKLFISKKLKNITNKIPNFEKVLETETKRLETSLEKSDLVINILSDVTKILKPHYLRRALPRTLSLCAEKISLLLENLYLKNIAKEHDATCAALVQQGLEIEYKENEKSIILRALEKNCFETSIALISQPETLINASIIKQISNLLHAHPMAVSDVIVANHLAIIDALYQVGGKTEHLFTMLKNATEERTISYLASNFSSTNMLFLGLISRLLTRETAKETLEILIGDMGFYAYHSRILDKIDAGNIEMDLLEKYFCILLRIFSYEDNALFDLTRLSKKEEFELFPSILSKLPNTFHIEFLNLLLKKSDVESIQLISEILENRYFSKIIDLGFTNKEIADVIFSFFNSLMNKYPPESIRQHYSTSILRLSLRLFNLFSAVSDYQADNYATSYTASYAANIYLSLLTQLYRADKTLPSILPLDSGHNILLYFGIPAFQKYMAILELVAEKPKSIYSISPIFSIRSKAVSLTRDPQSIRSLLKIAEKTNLMENLSCDMKQELQIWNKPFFPDDKKSLKEVINDLEKCSDKELIEKFMIRKLISGIDIDITFHSVFNQSNFRLNIVDCLFSYLNYSKKSSETWKMKYNLTDLTLANTSNEFLITKMRLLLNNKYQASQKTTLEVAKLNLNRKENRWEILLDAQQTYDWLLQPDSEFIKYTTKRLNDNPLLIASYEAEYNNHNLDNELKNFVKKYNTSWFDLFEKTHIIQKVILRSFGVTEDFLQVSSIAMGKHQELEEYAAVYCIDYSISLESKQQLVKAINEKFGNFSAKLTDTTLPLVAIASKVVLSKAFFDLLKTTYHTLLSSNDKKLHDWLYDQFTQAGLTPPMMGAPQISGLGLLSAYTQKKVQLPEQKSFAPFF